MVDYRTTRQSPNRKITKKNVTLTRRGGGNARGEGRESWKSGGGEAEEGEGKEWWEGGRGKEVVGVREGEGREWWEVERREREGFAGRWKGRTGKGVVGDGREEGEMSAGR